MFLNYGHVANPKFFKIHEEFSPVYGIIFEELTLESAVGDRTDWSHASHSDGSNNAIQWSAEKYREFQHFKESSGQLVWWLHLQELGENFSLSRQKKENWFPEVFNSDDKFSIKQICWLVPRNLLN